jgi:hypothetical protein
MILREVDRLSGLSCRLFRPERDALSFERFQPHLVRLTAEFGLVLTVRFMHLLRSPSELILANAVGNLLFRPASAETTIRRFDLDSLRALALRFEILLRESFNVRRVIGASRQLVTEGLKLAG